MKLLLIGGLIGLAIGVGLTILYFSLARFFEVNAKALEAKELKRRVGWVGKEVFLEVITQFLHRQGGENGHPIFFIKRSRCDFRKKNGQQCGANAQSGKTLCVFHDPAQAAAGRRARRLGGISRSQTAAVLPLETLDHPLNNVRDVSLLLAESINQVRRGQLAPRVATAIGYLTAILLSALQQGPLEERLQRLEATLDLKREWRTRHPPHESARIRETNWTRRVGREGKI
jgi:hypothetical protein